MPSPCRPFNEDICLTYVGAYFAGSRQTSCSLKWLSVHSGSFHDYVGPNIDLKVAHPFFSVPRKATPGGSSRASVTSLKSGSAVKGSRVLPQPLNP